MSVESKKVTEKLTFKEKKACVQRLVKEIHILAPTFIAITIIRQLLSVITAYIGIYISTMVLNRLEAGNTFRLIPEVLILLVISVVMYIVIGKLTNESEVVKNHSWQLLDIRMAVKNMEMNYPDLDSPYTNELYKRMEEDNRWGNGIYGGFDNFEKLCYQVFNALFAVGMLIPVLHQFLLNRSVITYVFFIVLIMLVIFNGIGEHYFGKKLTEYMALWTNDKPQDTNLCSI